MKRSSFLLLAMLFAIGCGDSGSPSADNSEKKLKIDLAAQSEGKKYLLAEAPDAKSVIEVRQKSKDGDEVVVIGQVGGLPEPFTDGRAIFLIADTTLKPTEGCDCPWDFCEYPNKEVAAARLTVRFTDDKGKTVAHGAREMFGIKELSKVVVKGKVSRDEKDNVIVVASGIHVSK
jgi:hypothetical protein